MSFPTTLTKWILFQMCMLFENLPVQVHGFRNVQLQLQKTSQVILTFQNNPDMSRVVFTEKIPKELVTAQFVVNQIKVVNNPMSSGTKTRKRASLMDVY